MMLRNRYVISPRNHIFRYRMRIYNSAFTFDKHDSLQSIHRKCPGIDHYRFELQLNSEFCSNVPHEFLTFNQKSINRLAIAVLGYILQQHSSNFMNRRFNSEESDRLYQHLRTTNDPIIKILNEKLSSKNIVPSALACTKTITTTTASLIIKLCLVC